ncbi:hypothetical protein JYG23_10775 [Sedimentibacter sp. zth1]|uniref:hypothetical protein n=1 Tax=Sedimentibacter sp. zth1 TaxID=2816908 RepID=UPI001A915839|nr:hypothetical protein [Sedimentibacter sp. zth1]QSX05164.1 hypothetical protein JYG23_10775 [Sedimentibacter sp. zth1]
MHNEIQKTTKIIDEFMALFIKKGCNEIDMKLKKEIETTKIFLVVHDTNLSNNEINNLNELLNIQRQYEVEEYYWELMGETSNEDELFLIGSMIDKAVIEKKKNNLYIEITRKIK